MSMSNSFDTRERDSARENDSGQKRSAARKQDRKRERAERTKEGAAKAGVSVEQYVSEQAALAASLRGKGNTIVHVGVTPEPRHVETILRSAPMFDAQGYRIR
jgi:hypothetical protein